MTEQEAVAYLHSVPRFGRAPTLDRMRSLMDLLGNPQDSLRFIHIAGTNGKGSTAALTASVLQAAGYKTGLYTSPYLLEFRERIRINGTLISPHDLIQAVEQVQNAVKLYTLSGGESLTEFELVTAAAFCYFSAQNCDLVVLETGLGGRFDATNIIQTPDAAVITQISLDHTGILGNTVEEIALEKCGILKPGGQVVLSSGQPESVRKIVSEQCTQTGCRLLTPSEDNLIAHAFSLQGTKLTYRNQSLTLPLLGRHQVQNLATTLTLVELLRERGYSIPDNAVSCGIASVSWPGRLQLCGTAPFFLADAAHNPGGIDVLLDSLKLYFPNRKPIVIMGMLRDKDFSTCIAKMAACSQAFLAVMPPSDRGLSACESADVARLHCSAVETFPSVSSAIDRGISLSRSDDVLCLCGSIPLVGEGLRYLNFIR